MNIIDALIEKIETSVQNNVVIPVENSNIELKDLSSGGKWTELYKTVNAFLNTDGGIIIIGVRETDDKDPATRRYRLTGFNRNDEPKLVNLRNSVFSDANGNHPDLSAFFPQWEIRSLADREVCVVYVEKLPEDEKFVFLNGAAYERIITGDHKIAPDKLRAQDERREELRNARELVPVPGTTIDDLNVNVLNDYIARLNTAVRIESYKSDIQSAMSFLRRRRFIREDGAPTLLGVFLCGNYVRDVLRGKCEVDCYVEIEGEAGKLYGEQKNFWDNINPLIEQCYAFVFRNIRIAVSVERGGTALPEYPDEVVRETINNAIAHRDYKSDGFSVISIVPQKHISIRNPGRFKQSLIVRADATLPATGGVCRIRRIIPNAVPQNPNLNDILKEFRKWEGRGVGMATLTNEALDNRIGVPYYILRTAGAETIELVVPAGGVLTSKMEFWLASFDRFMYDALNGRELTTEEQTVMAYLYQCEQLNAEEKYTVMFNESNNHYGALSELEKAGLIFRVESSGISAEHTVYMVNRTLTRKRYNTELSAMFGSEFDLLGNDYKDVLNALYQFNNYAHVSAPNANQIGRYLMAMNNPAMPPDAFQRKIRTIINRLEARNIVVRRQPNKPHYLLNTAFRPETTIFNS
jgi:ATP-dependent DNA helicase RecG